MVHLCSAFIQGTLTESEYYFHPFSHTHSWCQRNPCKAPSCSPGGTQIIAPSSGVTSHWRGLFSHYLVTSCWSSLWKVIKLWKKYHVQAHNVSHCQLANRTVSYFVTHCPSTLSDCTDSVYDLCMRHPCTSMQHIYTQLFVCNTKNMFYCIIN